MPAALTVWPNKIFKFLRMLITGLYPAGFLVLFYLLEIDSPLVAPTLFWSPPYLLKIQIANHSLFALLAGVTTKTTQQRRTQSPRAKYQHEEDTLLSTVKIHGLDTN